MEDGTDSGDLFSRDEILAGGSGAGRDTRRARAIVYLIEQETQRSADRQAGITAAGAAASAMAGSPLRLDELLDPEAQRGDLPGEADEAYLESFRAARRHAASPELRRLEREADRWAPLVPQRIDLRVRVLDLLAQRYELTTRNARRILTVFGAGDPVFVDTFARTCGRPLDEAVPTPSGGLLSRFRRR